MQVRAEKTGLKKDLHKLCRNIHRFQGPQAQAETSAPEGLCHLLDDHPQEPGQVPAAIAAVVAQVNPD